MLDKAEANHKGDSSTAGEKNSLQDECFRVPARCAETDNSSKSENNVKVEPERRLSLLEIVGESTGKSAVVRAGKENPIEAKVKESSDKSTDKTRNEQQKGADNELSEEEKGHARFFQSKRLLPQLAQITRIPEEFADKKRDEQIDGWRKAVESRESAIKQESQQENPWGPASQAAMADYLELMHLRMKSVLHGFESYGKELPPGTMLVVPEEQGKKIEIKDYASKVLTGDLRIEQANLSKPPSQTEYWKMEFQNSWLQFAETKLEKLKVQDQDKSLTDLIKERKLPEAWLYKEGQDKNHWRTTASSLVDLTLDLGRQVELIQQLQLPVELPAGTKVTKVNGRTNISLDLPENLNLDDPLNMLKVQRLESWRNETVKSLAPALKEAALAKGNPISVIAWNDLYLPSAKSENGLYKSTVAVFDEKKQLVSLADPFTFKPSAGQSTEPVNLLEQRPLVETDNDGNIKVTMQVQAQRVPWYSHQNLIYENIGKPAALPSRTFKPDEMVGIQNQNKMEYMLAKDLKTFFDRKAGLQYGEKALFLAMDLAMIATGTIELGAALKGARLLAQGADTLSPLTLAARLSKGTMDLSLGMTGPLTNAYWNSFESGQVANHARGMIFLGSAALAPAQTLVQFGKNANAGARRLFGASEQVPNLQNFYEQQANAMKFQELIKSGGRVVESTADYSAKVMQFGQVPMGLILSYEISHQLKELRNPYFGTSYENKAAGDRPSILRNLEAKAKTAPDSDERAAARLLQYGEIFRLKENSENKNDYNRIGSLFERSAQAVMSPAGQIHKHEIINELVDNLAFTNKEIHELEIANKGGLSSKQVSQLLDPDSRKLFPEPVRTRAEQLLQSKDQNLIAASRLALLTIFSQRTDIKEAVSHHSILPAAVPKKSVGLQLLPEHHVEVKFDAQSLANSMIKSLELLGADGRSLASTDALIRSGHLRAIQFAPMLEHVLSNKASSATERLRSVQLAVDSSGLLLKNENARIAMQSLLRNTATNDSDPSVRSLSAALFYGSKQAGLNTYDNAFTGLARRITAPVDGSAASNETQELISDLLLEKLGSKNPAEQRANAIESLNLLSSKMPSAEQARIQESILQSLSSSLLSAELHESVQFLQAINPDRFAAMFGSQETLCTKILSQAMELLKVHSASSYDATQERELIAVNRQVFNLVNAALDSNNSNLSVQKAKLISSYLEMATQVMIKSSAGYVNLRIQLIANAAKLAGAGLPENTETARSLASNAARDRSAMLRSAAFHALLEMSNTKDSRENILKLYAGENDPGIVQELQTLRTELNPSSEDQGQAACNLASLDKEIQLRYPDLAEFNPEREKAWINTFYPLLLKENFIKELVNIFKADRSSSSVFSSIQKQGEILSAERDKQFARLKSQASNNIEHPFTRLARVVLSSMAADKNNPYAVDSGDILLGQKLNRPFDEYSLQSSLASEPITQIYYRHKSNDWSAQAEQSLHDTLKGASGKDLSERLVQKVANSRLQKLCPSK